MSVSVPALEHNVCECVAPFVKKFTRNSTENCQAVQFLRTPTTTLKTYPATGIDQCMYLSASFTNSTRSFLKRIYCTFLQLHMSSGSELPPFYVVSRVGGWKTEF